VSEAFRKNADRGFKKTDCRSHQGNANKGMTLQVRYFHPGHSILKNNKMRGAGGKQRWRTGVFRTMVKDNGNPQVVSVGKDQRIRKKEKNWTQKALWEEALKTNATGE